ncbi:UNVERIFIED_CONTAM: hypothetical protein FKN15_067928 [Acipenser sinensis]
MSSTYVAGNSPTRPRHCPFHHDSSTISMPLMMSSGLKEISSSPSAGTTQNRERQTVTDWTDIHSPPASHRHTLDVLHSIVCA